MLELGERGLSMQRAVGSQLAKTAKMPCSGIGPPLQCYRLRASQVSFLHADSEIFEAKTGCQGDGRDRIPNALSLRIDD